MSECCKTGFRWMGTPEGKETKVTFTNARLLADHYAKETDATVYLVDFFSGEVMTPDMMENLKKANAFSVRAFLGRHSKAVRGPKIFAAAKALKQELRYKTVGGIGFCYGG
ncbi:hypothetical protein PV08_00001 [Exophiala spinifera]|uniref:Dienelactone hydrolase domain-containing protein n=1 Tax=Exophiala spinifera TaxID=91928 RepID=A0A0D2C793_9EURO|nr:uncharacterized protein PV08_00001 [Exophiala spinifera]KIW19429.1 hypothetical protein PV08_00001 [Exophiala spinifera]